MKNPRFWSKVQRGPGCWEWQAGCFPNGYGSYSVNGKTQGAHRIVWEMGHGVRPNNMYVCHTCDNPKCVRPSHLFLGTAKQNMMDASNKGRMSRGQDKYCSKVSNNEVIQIRADTRSQRKIAKEYGISHAAVGYIKRKETWKHIG